MQPSQRHERVPVAAWWVERARDSSAARDLESAGCVVEVLAQAERALLDVPHGAALSPVGHVGPACGYERRMIGHGSFGPLFLWSARWSAARVLHVALGDVGDINWQLVEIERWSAGNYRLRSMLRSGKLLILQMSLFSSARNPSLPSL
jgi:hypothetical protein